MGAAIIIVPNYNLSSSPPEAQLNLQHTAHVCACARNAMFVAGLHKRASVRVAECCSELSVKVISNALLSLEWRSSSTCDSRCQPVSSSGIAVGD